VSSPLENQPLLRDVQVEDLLRLSWRDSDAKAVGVILGKRN